MEERLPKGTLGGQAVIEGVMMKGPKGYSVAIRKPDQKIEVKLEKYQSYGDKHKFCKMPFIRGVVNFVESMVIGMKTLSYSSSFYEEEEEETKVDQVFKKVFKEKAESVALGFTVLLSIVIAVAIFMLLPTAIAELIGRWVPNRILLTLIEGVLRLVIFILYVLLISQMEDIKRVFMYHGAEHKTINCYESGDDLTPENVAKHSRYHKRCGTSFLFIVMVISIFVFMFITAEQMWLRFVLRLILIPVVASLSYEFIRLAGRNDNAFFNILSKPGMWVQKITTKKPDEEMIQVAIISVEAVLYGDAYVKAVNEAQGIGVEEKTDAKENRKNRTKQKKASSDSEELSYEDVELGQAVLGDGLENEALEYEETYEEEYETYEEEQEEYEEEYESYEEEQEEYEEEYETYEEEPGEYEEEYESYEEEPEINEEYESYGEKTEMHEEEYETHEEKPEVSEKGNTYGKEHKAYAVSDEKMQVPVKDEIKETAAKEKITTKKTTKKTAAKKTKSHNDGMEQKTSGKKKENDKDELIQDFDISEFEKSFFED